VEPVGEVADDVGNDGGQVLGEEGAHQVSAEPEARYYLAMSVVLNLSNENTFFWIYLQNFSKSRAPLTVLQSLKARRL
jgi:hypothetical protein